MKKITLFVLLLFGFLTKVFAIDYAYYYMNCDGVRTELGKSFMTGGELGPCLKLCSGCKLEIAIYQVPASAPPRWIPLLNIQDYRVNSTSPNSILNYYDDITGTRKEISVNAEIIRYEDPITGDFVNYRYSIDFSNLSSGVSRIGNIAINTKTGQLGFNFNDCVTITHPSILDDVQAGNLQICKGECLKLNQIVSNTSVGGIISFGCGPDPLLAFSGLGGPGNLNDHKPCFNEIGHFPLCFKVKNGGCSKDITGVIEVIDCPETSNCQACCTYIQNNGIGIAVTGYGQNSIYHLSGQLGSQTPCGMGYFEITFADGSKITSNDNTVGPFPQKVSKVCYKISGCYECAPACLYVE